MTFDPLQLVGLPPLQRKVHACVMQLVARRGWAPRLGDVSRALSNEQPEHVRYSVRRLLKKQHVKRLPDGGLVALNAPHAQLIHETCRRYNITIDDLRGPEKPWRMQRIRREFAVKLYRKYFYSFTAIGVLLDRHRTTVETFCKPDVRQRRSEKRLAAYRAMVAERSAPASQPSHQVAPA